MIVAGLVALHREGRRRVAAAEARALEDNPVDLAEIRAIQVEMADLHAGRSSVCLREAQAMSGAAGVPGG